MTTHMVFWLLSAAVLGITAWTFAGLRRDSNRLRAACLAGLRGAAAILLAWVFMLNQLTKSGLW